MRGFWNVLWFVLIIVAVLAMFVLAGHTDQDRNTVCIEHGYERAEHLGGQYMCIGVRDGNTIVTPFDQVKEKLK